MLIANGGGNVGVGTTAPGAKLDVDTGRIQISSSGTKQLSFGTDATIEFGSDSNMQVRRSGSSLQFKTGGSEVMRIDSAGNVGIGTTTPSAKLEVSGNIKVGDSEQFIAGTGNDLKIYHDGTDSVIQNDIGDLEIQNRQDDGNIVFKSDDGSGGVATYFYLDGQNTRTEFLKDVKFPDNVKANFGTSVDLQIHHDGTNSLILNDTGRLIIRNRADDQDIEFDCDDGAGGVTTYFYLDGGGVLTRFDKRLRMSDAVGLQLGSSGNFEMYHFSGNTTMDNFTGNLTIRNSANDKDISFACDDGSGGAATYFFLDGSTASGGSLYTQFPDNSNLTFGAGNDLRIYHNGTNSNIENFNGTLQFVQNLNDGDIKFLCDDGSGGVSAYITLDGSNVRTRIDREMRFMDTIPAKFGTGGDLEIYHNASDSVIENNVGDLYITNKQDDGNIIFRSDNGSGGVATYFYLDGGNTFTNFQLNARWVDNAKAQFGNSGDLQIYHDGSNSYIQETGTGVLYIQGSGNVQIEGINGENMIICNENGSVQLHYDSVQKFQTTSTGVKITGVSEYANNTAALAGGLVVGDVYRTGDDLKIVH